MNTERIEVIKELYCIVGDIIVCVDYLSLDVFDICKRVFAGDKLGKYNAFTEISEGDFKKRWIDTCDKSLIGISSYDRKLFSEIGNVLGTCDSGSQIKKLSYIEKELEKSYAEKISKLRKNKKLYQIIGLSLGAVVCLVTV